MTKKTEKKRMDKSEAQFFWVVAIITILIISIILTPILYKKFFASFEYAGIKFEKTKSGELVFYHGVFPINYYGKTYSIHNVYFRTDPRENNVSFNIDKVALSKNIFVSLSKDIQHCEDVQSAQITLGSFMGAFPFVKNITAGIMEEDFAKENNLPFITCDNASANNVVIMVNNSVVESIEKVGENCYAFNIGNCRYLPTAEKFIVGAMSQVNEVEI